MIGCRFLPAFLAILPALAQPANSNRAPNAAEQTAALAAIKEYALNYPKHLPDYICSQVTQARTVVFSIEGDRKLNDSIEAKVGVIDHKEVGKLVSRNGIPADAVDASDIAQTLLRGEADTLMTRIFDPEIPAEFRWDKVVTRENRRLYVFTFKVPQANGYPIPEGKRQIQVPFKGSVFADPETKAILRIEMQIPEFPSGSFYRSLDLKIDYKPTTLAEHQLLLPSDFEMNVQQPVGTVKVNAEYKDYRRFDGDPKSEFGR